MRLESKKYVHDIARAAQFAMVFVQGKSFSEYATEVLLRSAVERQLQTAGEALSQLSRIDRQTAARFSEHERIIAFRNILVHGYAQIDNRVVSGVLENSLPLLCHEAESMLAEG